MATSEVRCQMLKSPTTNNREVVRKVYTIILSASQNISGCKMLKQLHKTVLLHSISWPWHSEPANLHYAWSEIKRFPETMWKWWDREACSSVLTWCLSFFLWLLKELWMETYILGSSGSNVKRVVAPKWAVRKPFLLRKYLCWSKSWHVTMPQVHAQMWIYHKVMRFLPQWSSLVGNQDKLLEEALEMCLYGHTFWYICKCKIFKVKLRFLSHSTSSSHFPLCHGTL